MIEEESEKFNGPTPLLADDDEVPHQVSVADCVNTNGHPILAGSITDAMINVEVLLPQCKVPKLAKVLRQYVDKNRKVIENKKKSHCSIP